MVAKELINHMVPPLKLTDDAHKAIIWMEELRCEYLPVINESKFMGMINEDMILDLNDIDRLIMDIPLTGKDCFVTNDTHFYDVVKKSSDNNIQSVAVVDDNNEYLGVITIQDTITAFAQSEAVQTTGAIIVLSMDHRDYSLAEISRLIEENQVKIINSNVRVDENDPNKIKLTLKINSLEINRVIATLERFDYKIIAQFKESAVSVSEKDRLDQLFRYLEI